jgi:hypothetical protein
MTEKGNKAVKLGFVEDFHGDTDMIIKELRIRR